MSFIVLCEYMYVVMCIHVHIQGNYDAYVRTRAELEENQMKRYQWEQDQMQHMKVCAIKKPVTGELYWILLYPYMDNSISNINREYMLHITDEIDTKM